MGDVARINIRTPNAGGARAIFARIDHGHDSEIFVLCQADCAERRAKNNKDTEAAANRNAADSNHWTSGVAVKFDELHFVSEAVFFIPNLKGESYFINTSYFCFADSHAQRVNAINSSLWENVEVFDGNIIGGIGERKTALERHMVRSLISRFGFVTTDAMERSHCLVSVNREEVAFCGV